MGQLSKKLRNWASDSGHGVSFFCPGCKSSHSIKTSEGGWGWNGDVDRPTFTPSVLVRTGHHVPDFADRFPAGAEKSCWCTYNAENPDDTDKIECTICHSFVTDGMIQFLGDSTHALAGQTVPLADFPEHYG